MHFIRVVVAVTAVAVISALAPVAAVANTPDQPASLDFVRSAVGHLAGFAARDRGFHGGFARHERWHYHAWHTGNWIGVYPYAYGCPYPDSYTASCTWPNG